MTAQSVDLHVVDSLCKTLLAGKVRPVWWEESGHAFKVAAVEEYLVQHTFDFDMREGYQCDVVESWEDRRGCFVVAPL